MKRSLKFIAIIAFAAFALSGCQFVIGIIFETDLYVENIEPDFDNDGQFSGVDVTIGNDGAKAEDVRYEVVLSEDTNADDGDPVVYSGQFNIDFKDTATFWVPAASMALDGVDLPPTDPYVGVILDVDDSDSGNNSGTTRDPIPGIAIEADIYEPDSAGEPRSLDSYYSIGSYPFSAAEFHTFHTTDVEADEDWFYVYLPAYYTLDLYTYSAGGSWDCDTVIEALYWDPELSEWVSAGIDDDGGEGYYSWLSVYDPTGYGYDVDMYVGVYEYDGNLGEYNLDIEVYPNE